MHTRMEIHTCTGQKSSGRCRDNSSYEANKYDKIDRVQLALNYCNRVHLTVPVCL